MKKIIFILSILVAAPMARAEGLVEPYIGYHTGEWERGTAGEDMAGITYGVRAGYKGAGLMLGIDYMMGMWEDESNPKNDVTPSDLGIFVGYQASKLRLYAVLSPDPLNPTLKFKNSSGNSKWEGSTMKLGLGFMVTDMVAINFEHMTGTYDEQDGNTVNQDLDTKMIGATVSLPFTF